MENDSKQYQIIARDYWENKITSWHMDDLFIDFNAVDPGASGTGNGYGSVRFTVEPSNAYRIKTIANHNEMVEYIIYLSFYSVLLYRYYRQPEVVISSAGIKNQGEKNAADSFLFYKLQLKEEDSFKDMFRETGREIQETWKHSSYNYGDMETVFKNNHIDIHPLYRFGFFDNRINADSKAFDKVNLQFRLKRISNDRLEIYFKFKKNVFKKEFVQAMASHYKNLLMYIDGGLDHTIEDIEILSLSEKRQLLVDFNRSPADDPPIRNLVEVFQEKAGMFPNNIALQHEGTHVTYKALNEWADRVAHVLRKSGVKRDTVAALMMERSVEMIIGVLGILKAGGAYLPINPEYPEDRIHYMLTDSGAAVLLTNLPGEHHFDCQLSIVNYQLFMGSPDISLYHSSNQFIEPIHHSSNLAYIIYTSGSTGKPKGVMVEHRNVVSLVLNETFSFKFGPNDVWTLFHSICFDVSVWEVFGALLYGGKLIVVPTGVARTPRAMAELLEKEKVTILNQIPTVFINLAAEVLEPGKKRALVLRYIIFAGDALKPSLLEKWHETYPAARLVNMYGITETTVHTTFKEINTKEIEAGISTIGQALPAWQCYITDHKLRLLPVGIAGEILVGGAGVSRGYLNRPGLTAERFASNVHVNHVNTYMKEERLYQSGDLARWLPEGNMEFLGRIDHQVKIRGFRVECGEIETRLLGWEKIKEAVVVARHSSLLAFLVTKEDIDTEKIREYLRLYLPDYMIPEYFIQLDRFPLTASGKIDKKALPDPDSSYTAGKVYESPRTSMEKALTNIWQEVLGIEKIGIHDNFFSLGGNSIKGIQVVNKVQEWFEEIMHVSVLFEAPTVEKLAAVLDKQGIAPEVPGAGLDESAVIKMRQIITPLAPLKVTAPKNPPALFILSPPRSGSTLLRVILAGHPGLFAPPELELLSFNTLQERKAALSGKFGYFKEGVIRAIMEIKHCSSEEAQNIMQEFEHRGLTSQEFYGVMQQWLGDRLLVDKTPWYALDPETLKRAEAYFEAPRYIHLVRDPYAVIHSFEKANLDQIFRYNHNFPVRQLAQLIWLICHQNILAFLNDIPGDRKHTITFEALVHQPETAAAELCDFLDIHFREEMLRVYQDTGSKMLDGIHPESKMLGDINFLKHKRIDSDVVEKWKHDYKEDFLGDITRQLARSLGYLYLEPYPVSRYFKIEVVPEAEYYELSNAQKRLWILAQFEEGSSAYNILTAYLIEGKLDRDALEKSYKDIVKRHEILRTTFIQVEGEPKQKVHNETVLGFKFEYLDLRNDPMREEKARKLAYEETGYEFDLEKGPLSRAKLLQLDEEKYLFLLTLHHIITDEWSMGVLVYDILRLYNAFQKGRENPLPPPPFQYKDYSAWQNQRKESSEIKQQAEYWLKQFKGEIPILDLPMDFPRPMVQSFEGRTVNFEITNEATAALKNLALKEGATSFMVLLSVFNIFLARITQQEDILVGTPITGRRYADLEGIIGMFVNTLALRNYPNSRKTFKNFLREVKEKTLEAFENQEYQFEDLVEEVSVARDFSRNPLFDVMFVLQNIDIQPGAAPGTNIEPEGLKLIPYDYENRTSKFDLTLFAFDSSKTLFFTFEFSTSLFKEETIERFIYYFKQLITSVLHTPDRVIAQLEMIPEAEKVRLLQEFNDTDVEYPGHQTVHRLFEEQVEKSGDRVAVYGMVNQQLSYQELNKRANQMAWLLREKGTGPDTVVALWMERSLDMIVVILGILKAGGAYLPIDTDYPTRRVKSILKESEAPFLLQHTGISFIEEPEEDRSMQVNCEIILVDQVTERLRRCPTANLEHINRPEDLLYLISTSGSTGRPKSVMLEHRNMVNLLNFEFSGTNMDFSGHVMQFASIGFDVSAQEIFSTFLKGGKLFIINKNLRADVLQLFAFIDSNNIGILFLPPAFLKLVFTHPDFAAVFPRCVRHICAAGEQLIVPEPLKQHLAAHKVYLHNYYGPAETHVVTTLTIDPAAFVPGRLSIGEPIANTKIYILDTYQNLQPIGVKGELYISGSNVGRGYLNNPALTMERFNRSYKSYMSYKTGDLARWLPGGTIEFLGRADHQVKLRGFRVELEEIETQLLRQKGIKEAVVIAKQNERGDMYLCAYFVPAAGDITVLRLREALEAVLPDYMVPAYLIPLERIPINTSGKLDRKGLPAPEMEAGDSYTTPSGEIQETLAAIWSEVLEVEPGIVGIDSNFFNLGGHSLKATVLLAKMHKALNVKITLTEMFKTPTIRHLSKLVKAARGDKYKSIEPVEKKEYYPLSSAQKRLFILQQMELESTAYNMPQAILFKEAPDVELLEQTFKRLIHRHESFRTSFQMVNNEPVQKIHDHAAFKIDHYDRIHHSSFIEASNHFIKSFDLSMSPLLRAGLIKIRENEHILMVDMHHIISDGVSHEILVKDFISFFRGAWMPGLKLQYKDFSAWQNSEKEREKIKQQETYWLKELEGEIPVLDMPIDYTRPEVQSFEGNTLNFEIESDTTAALKNMALAEGSTLFMTLLAIYYVFLSKVTRQEDIIIGTPTAGRSHADLEQIIGMFVNTLAVRSTPAGEKTFKAFLSDVTKGALEAFENQDYPFEDLVEKVFVNRDAGRNPLFDVVFVFLDELAPLPRTAVSPGEARENPPEPYEFDSAISKFDLTLSGTKNSDRLLLSWEYCTRLFKPGTIERFIRCFKKIVSAVIENPEQKISGIEIIPEKEKREVLFEFNQPLAAYPKDKTIHELFEEQADKNPDRTALIGIGTMSITYRELNQKSHQLAWVLIEKGVKPDHIVAVLVERSVEMIIGILAILKAGGAYLPIDPEYPEERIKYMLADSGAGVLLTNLHDLQRFNGQWSIVNYQWSMRSPKISLHHSTFITHHSDNLAYIIYTSGTTGKSKGALIEHKNVVSLLFNEGRLFDFDRNDVWTMFHSYCFDFSVWEMYGALLYGGKLVIIPQMVVKDTRQFLEILKKERVTVLNQTPAAFYNLAQLELQEPGKQLKLKYVIFGGDVLKPAKLKQWKEKYQETELINMFGITETTVHVTFKKIEDKDIQLNISNIGHPLPALNTYVMDSGLNLVPIGVAGELCVEGEGVGRGYLNRPELTKKKFGNSPYFPGQKHYLSGDSGRFLENGEIEYLGRIDLQVKIRGYRVEPGEIENQLLKHDNIKDAVVIAGKSTTGDAYLCAYVVPAKETKPSLSELKEYLATDLPPYMIPTYFVFMEKIPLTANGKIDRRVLPGPVVETMEEYIAPRNETEETLAQIWHQVLILERVGIRDNYFNLGGDSIKAIKLLSMVNREFNINLRIVDLFTDETIEKLSARIKREKGGYTDEEFTQALKEIEAFKTRCLAKNELLRENIEDIYPMSDIEKGMVFHALKEPGQAIYHDQVVHQLTYPDFALGRLKKALALMVDKHPILRTSFNLTDFEEAVQVVHKKTHVDIEHEDISHMEIHDQEEYIKRFIAEDRQNPIDPSSPPLWRMRTFSLDSHHVVVLWVCHHAIMDGWSDASFNTELNNIYLELKTDPGYVPLKLKSSYREFIVEQRVHQKKKDLRDYWRNELQDYKRLEFPGSDGSREGPAAVKNVSLDLGISLMERLKEMASDSHTSLKHVCFSAYIYMLSMLSYENEIVTGLVTNNRPVCEDGEKILGCFLNTIPVRMKISSPIIWSDYIRVVDKKLKELARYDHLSLLEIVKLTGEEISDQNPLFDALFNFVDFFVYKEAHREVSDHSPGIEDDQRLSVTGQVRANTLFDFSIDSTFGEFVLSLSYSNLLLTDPMVWQLIHYFKEILNKFIEEPNAAAAKEQLISDEEKQKLLYDFNRTDDPYPGDKTIHELFEDQVSKTPDYIALIGPICPIGPISLSYKEMAKKSNQLARLLGEKGVKPDTIVGIMAEPSVEMIIGILGILKAGGAYLPIDPNYPEERIKYMLRDSGTGILLTDLPEGHRFNGQWSMVNYQLSMSNVSHSLTHLTHPTHPTYPTHLCYVIYTSGSTGTPNGVMVEHQSLVNLCFWHNRYYSITSADRATKFAGTGFDASVWEIFPYLIAGASLYIIDDETKMEVEKLNRYFEKNRITIAFLPTPMGEQFMEVENRSLRKLLVGGDKLRLFRKRRYELYNNYGPTEYTVVTTAGRVDSGKENIPIGRPIGNTRVYILDKYANIQPIHVAGELCIAGDGLSRGYLNNPELTAEKFPELQDNFPEGTGGLAPLLTGFYRTGDLARWKPDGTIQYLGRIDNQVKIRGYRIETGEVETCLLNHEAVKEAVVTAVEVAGDRQLCAYIVPASSNSLETTRLREYLAAELPGFMLPSYVVPLAEMPLTPSGKINRRVLPKPGEADFGGERTPAAPRNPLEKQLVEIWKNVLGRDNVGINDNFFMVGGDSIKAIQVISRMNKAGYKIVLKNLFSAPTISQLAPNVRKSESMGEQAPVSGIIPLTPIQHWFFQSNIINSHHFNQAVTLYSAEGFEEAAVKAVFTKIQEHHDTLRMTYQKTAAGEIVQTGHDPDYPLSLAVYDFRDKTSQQEAAEAIKKKADEIQAGIDLEKGPLMKLGLFRQQDGDRLLIVAHHLVIDGISWRILFEDINALYSQYKRGETFSLPLKTDSFKHWAEKLTEYANSKTFFKEKIHWTPLASLQVPSIRKDFEVDSNQVADTERLAFRLSEEETDLLLTRVNEAFGTEINDILLTSLALAFQGQFGLCKLLVALEGHGREDILTDMDTSRTVGWFTSVYPVFLEVSQKNDLARQIKEIKETLHRIPNKGIGWGILKYLTAREFKRDINFNLQPQVSFNYLGQVEAGTRQAFSFGVVEEPLGHMQSPNGQREYLLDISGIIFDNQLTMSITYNKKQFKPQTIEGFRDHFKSELVRIISFCSAREQRETTPSDFGYKKLSIEELDSIFD
jgi:amino acid adenylation domain-containing protein/non-ribosomal peptide synthase protein (TIGR01720 family)